MLQEDVTLPHWPLRDSLSSKGSFVERLAGEQSMSKPAPLGVTETSERPVSSPPPPHVRPAVLT